MLTHRFDPQTADVNRKIRKVLKDVAILGRGIARELIQQTPVAATDFSAAEQQAYIDLGTALDSIGS